jgi:hypothetical protein
MVKKVIAIFGVSGQSPVSSAITNYLFHILHPFSHSASLKFFNVAMAMLQNFALQKEKMKAKYLKYYFSNALLVDALQNTTEPGGLGLISKTFFCGERGNFFNTQKENLSYA